MSYPELSASIDDTRISLSGVIDSNSPQYVSGLLDTDPDVRTVEFVRVEGSVDDDANLELARTLRQRNMQTHIGKDGLIASGGTDLFLSGATRSIEAGACIGVHSWGAPSLTGITEGKDVPRDDPQHQLYLSYYEAMGVAPEFYWYTLDAAPLDGVHWMSVADLNRFGFSTQPIPEDQSVSKEARDARCNSRLSNEAR